MKLCTIAGCTRKMLARGWCSAHYKRWKFNGDPLASKQHSRADWRTLFWVKVQKSDGCWNWTAAKAATGYGLFRVPGRKWIIVASRVSWELANGPIPEGMFVCHHCDNPSCVRPDHLFVGSHADNNRDRHRKGRTKNIEEGRAKWHAVQRAKTHCLRGHPLVPGNLYAVASGHRKCRQCNLEWKALRRRGIPMSPLVASAYGP